MSLIQTHLQLSMGLHTCARTRVCVRGMCGEGESARARVCVCVVCVVSVRVHVRVYVCVFIDSDCVDPLGARCQRWTAICNNC